MTKNEILEYFKDINHAYNDCTRYDTLKRMIDELQEPCTDAISRQAAIVALDNRMSSLENVDMQIAMGFAKGIIHGLPPVTSAEKVGAVDSC